MKSIEVAGIAVGVGGSHIQARVKISCEGQVCSEVVVEGRWLVVYEEFCWA